MPTDDRDLRSRDLTDWPLGITVSSEGGLATVAITGEIDLATVDEAVAVIGAAEKIGSKVVVDLSEVSFIDSTGLLALVQLSSDNKHHGGRLSFIPSKHESVRRGLALTGIREFLS